MISWGGSRRSPGQPAVHRGATAIVGGQRIARAVPRRVATHAACGRYRAALDSSEHLCRAARRSSRCCPRGPPPRIGGGTAVPAGGARGSWCGRGGGGGRARTTRDRTRAGPRRPTWRVLRHPTRPAPRCRSTQASRVPQRARLHLRMAGWLERARAARPDEVAEVIGRHYAAALDSAPVLAADLGDGVTRDAARILAAAWFERGAQAALAGAAYDSARRLFERVFQPRPDDLRTADAYGIARATA